jgi:maleamate amidohydrolase
MSRELADNYRGAFDGRLGFGERPALLLVDLAQAYFDESCPLYAGVENELASAIRIIDAAREAGIPIVYTNVVYRPDGSDGGVFYKKVPVLENFVAGNPMGAWAAGIQPADDEIVVSKQYPSAFFGTQLDSKLKDLQVDSVIIAGLTTSGCIRASCVDAMSHGFIPIIVADACGDRHEAPHEANLFDMNAKYGDVVSEADALEYLRNLGAS